MGFSTAAKNAMLGALSPDTASLHTGDPGASGTSNEITGGTPAYARKAISYAAASGGSRAASSQPVFDVPAGTTVAYVALWAGATFLGSSAVTNETFAQQGTYTLTADTLTLT